MSAENLVWGDTLLEKQLLIGPMVSLISGEGQDRRSQAIAISKIAIMRVNIDAILQMAAISPATLSGEKSDISILDILQGSYIMKEAGKWSLYGNQIQIVREFVHQVFKKLQLPQETAQIGSSNEEIFKIAA